MARRGCARGRYGCSTVDHASCGLPLVRYEPIVFCINSFCVYRIARKNGAFSPTIALTSFPLSPAPLTQPSQPTLIQALQVLFPLFAPIYLSPSLFSNNVVSPRITSNGDLQAGLLQLPKRSLVLLSEQLLPSDSHWVNGPGLLLPNYDSSSS
jgi:hypothetical protein